MAGVKRPRPRDAPLSLGVAVEGPGVAARAVRCGVEHLAVLLEGGGLLVWALHRRGAVSSALSGGLHEGLGKVHTIRGLDLRDVACGWGHSAAVVRSGEVVAWGLDAYGEPASAPGGPRPWGTPATQATSTWMSGAGGRRFCPSRRAQSSASPADGASSAPTATP